MNRRKALKLAGGLTVGALVPFGSSIASGRNTVRVLDPSKQVFEFKALHRSSASIPEPNNDPFRGFEGRRGEDFGSFKFICVAVFKGDYEWRLDTRLYRGGGYYNVIDSGYFHQGNSRGLPALVFQKLDEGYKIIGEVEFVEK